MTANQTTDAGTDQEVLVEGAGTLIAQVKAGSVTVLVRRAPVTVQVPQKNGKDSAAGEASQKTYDSVPNRLLRGERAQNPPEKHAGESKGTGRGNCQAVVPPGSSSGSHR